MDLHWLIQHRRLTFACVLVVFLATGAGLFKLQVSTDNRIFYGPENPYFLDFLDFESRFTTNDNIVFVLNAPFTIREREFPSAIRWLTDHAFTLDHVIRVDSLSNYPYPLAEGDSISVESFLDWACPESTGCTRPAEAALDDLQLRNRLVSSDLRSAGIIATVSIERGAVGQIESLQAQTKALAANFRERFPDIEIYFTGGVPMMVAFATATADDLSLLLPIAFAVIFVLLILVLGSPLLATLLLGIGILSAAIVLGTAGWLGHVVNNATSIAPVVVMTLVVTSAMHVAAHFSMHYFLSDGTITASEQAIVSTRENFKPIVVSALISSATLASLSLVDSPPLQQLGILATSGVLVGCVLTITLLPVCLTYMPRATRIPLGNVIQHLINKYASQIEKSGPPAIVAATFFFAGALGLSQLKIDDDFVRFFDPSVEFRAQTDKATELLTGPNHIEVILEAPEGTTVFQPEFLLYLKRVTEDLRAEPLVANAHSFSDVMHHLSRVFFNRGIDKQMSEDELNQLYLIYELSLSMGQTNTDLVSADHRFARLSVLLKQTSSSDIQELEARIYKHHELQHTPYSLKVTGENIPVAHLSRMNIASMLVEIGITLMITAIALGLLFRSCRLGFVALLATTAPVLAGFGIWGWTAGTIGLAATAIIALTTGVVVDNTAHFLFQFLDAASKPDFTPRAAAAYATRKVGSAVVSTSVAMGAGLAILVLSDFEVNSIFGFATCLIIFLALIFDLAILPRLATWSVSSRLNAEQN